MISFHHIVCRSMCIIFLQCFVCSFCVLCSGGGVTGWLQSWLTDVHQENARPAISTACALGVLNVLLAMSSSLSIDFKYLYDLIQGVLSFLFLFEYHTLCCYILFSPFLDLRWFCLNCVVIGSMPASVQIYLCFVLVLCLTTNHSTNQFL